MYTAANPATVGEYVVPLPLAATIVALHEEPSRD
jgi:hypothetical protein